MIDKVQKIREEVERLQNELIQERKKDYGSDVDDACILELQNVLTYIDSLQEEPINEDLEEAAKKYGAKKHPMTTIGANESAHDFKAGAKWQKEQMMKDAVDNTCMVVGKVDDHINVRIGVFEKPHEIWHCKCDKSKFKIGDKVKLIIIKAD